MSPSTCHLRLCGLSAIVLLAGCTSTPQPRGPLRELVGGLGFAEGPATAPDGSIYFTDQPNDAILHWDPTTDDVTLWRTPSGRANGMEFDREGRLVACADGANELVRFEADGSVTTLVAAFDGKLLNGPNDVWIAPNGDAYFTDPWYRRAHWRDHPLERRRNDPRPEQSTEAVYRFRPSTTKVERVAEGFVRPNGITGSPDGLTLYVADIGANATYAFSLQSDGSLRDRRLFVLQGSDGMTVDHEGNVYLTGNGVTIVTPTGNVVGHIAVPRPWTSNVTFAGPDRSTLIITAGESLFAVPMSVRGVRE